MDCLFASPPARPRSNAWLAASAAFHLTCIGTIVAIGARVASTPAPVSPHRSITFVNVAAAIAVPPPPEAAPQLDRIARVETPRAVAQEPAPLPPRPIDPPRVATVTPDPASAPVVEPASVPETPAVAAVQERPEPVLGMFDRAASARQGVVSGSVRAAGFAEAQRSVPRRPAADGAPQSAGFDRAAAPRVSITMAPPVAAAIDTPIEVLFKPSPDYTDEARTLRIQGEVVVEAAFDPSGQVSVVRVVQGLGHGLDETAARAVARIQFRPATRDGVPVTVRTLVHIEFRLA